jgi:AbrB family looped-hinge helix DNA binding protein
MSRISRKNQVTIPKDVLTAAGLSAGDDVRINGVGRGRIELVRSDDLIDEYAGIFDEAVYPPGYLKDLRDEWE